MLLGGSQISLRLLVAAILELQRAVLKSRNHQELCTQLRNPAVKKSYSFMFATSKTRLNLNFSLL